MKRKLCLVMTVAWFMLGIFPLRAQTATDGTDFWLTFGENYLHSQNSPSDHQYYNLNLQIRIASMDLPTTGTIYFTKLDTAISFTLLPQEVFTYNIPDYKQKEATYNVSDGISDRSVHIVSNNPVTVYALNQTNVSTDATNLLPLPALGTDYYQISHIPRSGNKKDAYAVIATQDNTHLYHDGVSVSEGALNAGQVYYRINPTDMTGAHITSDKPVAFFSLNPGTNIPNVSDWTGDCLMQQLAPVHTWGKSFFAPVSDLTTETCQDTKDRIRIVASQDNTIVTITPQDDILLITDTGGETDLATPLQAGQFFEVQITLEKNGCFVYADKPVGVCTYLTSRDDNNEVFSDPSMAWLPAIDQRVPQAMIAPFVPTGTTEINAHCALIVTPTANKNNTTVSIGGAPPTNLNGGVWHDNDMAQMSFYNMPLTDKTASYLFTNNEGVIIMCYGVGERESYYYLAYSAMHDLTASFYANDIHYQILPYHVFCTSDIHFRADITDLNPAPGSLKWYIDGIEEIAARDKSEWNKSFPVGEYDILLETLSLDNETLTLSSTLVIGVPISASASPPEGGSVKGDGCAKVNNMTTLTASPNECYTFTNWTENGQIVSTNTSYTFMVTQPRTLVANFELKTFNITVLANPPEGGSVTGNDAHILCGEDKTVTAVANTLYEFVNWTENGTTLSEDASYSLTVTETHTLTANFENRQCQVIATVNDEEYGSTTGSGAYNAGSSVRVETTSSGCHRFVNWTIDGKEVSKDRIYIFTVMDDVTVVANFYALDFDAYAPMLWNNTFMLNLRRLKEEGYRIIGCEWYKNGDLEPDTRTIDEFSYSAGPKKTNLLEPAPTWYMFKLLTTSHGPLCSTHKTVEYHPLYATPDGDLTVYPNPALSGNAFTVEGVAEGSTILVYNQYGICVSSIVATENPVTLTLNNLQPGMYLIRASGKQMKVVVR
ncbi:MAG: T9SS type A sorting domain-containing protein [Bacteroidales bacterium]|nr:T9SS type A sorting domain-containing protein [Bacteroidales bacterium]